MYMVVRTCRVASLCSRKMFGYYSQRLYEEHF